MKIIQYDTFDNVKMDLNLYYPENKDKDVKRGIVVFFFGGGWSGGTVKQFEPQAKELVRLGMAAALPSYRVLSRDGTPIEVAIQDAIYCVGHLYEHADEYGIDRDKIVLSGGSAGAHIALSSVLLDTFIPEKFQYKDKIKGLLLCNPVLDAVQFAERAEAIKKSSYSPIDISPIHHIRKDMPDTVIFQGTIDQTVPVEKAREYAENVRQIGNECKLVEYDGCGHGFFNLRNDQIMNYYHVLGHMVQFLKDHNIFELDEGWK